MDGDVKYVVFFIVLCWSVITYS